MQDGFAVGGHADGSRGRVVERFTEAVDLMRQIKSLLDPNGILAPGKSGINI